MTRYTAETNERGEIVSPETLAQIRNIAYNTASGLDEAVKNTVVFESSPPVELNITSMEYDLETPKPGDQYVIDWSKVPYNSIRLTVDRGTQIEVNRPSKNGSTLIKVASDGKLEISPLYWYDEDRVLRYEFVPDFKQLGLADIPGSTTRKRCVSGRLLVSADRGNASGAIQARSLLELKPNVKDVDVIFVGATSQKIEGSPTLRWNSDETILVNGQPCNDVLVYSRYETGEPSIEVYDEDWNTEYLYVPHTAQQSAIYLKWPGAVEVDISGYSASSFSEIPTAKLSEMLWEVSRIWRPNHAEVFDKKTGMYNAVSVEPMTVVVNGKTYQGKRSSYNQWLADSLTALATAAGVTLPDITTLGFKETT